MISHELWKSNTQTCCVRTGPMNIVKLLPKCVTSGRFRSQGGALWHNVHYKLKVFHIFTFFIFWNSLLLLNIQLAFYTKVVNIQTLPPGSGTWVICPRTRFLWKKKMILTCLLILFRIIYDGPLAFTSELIMVKTWEKKYLCEPQHVHLLQRLLMARSEK